jgi:hypothetical protein
LGPGKSDFFTTGAKKGKKAFRKRDPRKHLGKKKNGN